ncbi:MAG TPA: hypothetical protein PLJ21_00775 [Pseudobdellovibrionaceae bacterium]|nr:hypothetical protein [Pseudobdellovibrionaceae bacterium]
MKTRSDMHYLRKIWHMGAVFLLFILYRLIPETMTPYFFGVLAFIAVAIDALRLRSPLMNDLVMAIFKPLMRASEVKGYAGTTFLLTGVFIIVLAFPKVVVSLTLLFLAFGDPIASFIGIRYGKDKIFGHKSIQGFIAAFVVCLLITLSYFYVREIMSNRLFVVSLISGMIGALAELIPISKIDDNLSLPILSSLGLFIVFFFFGLL